MPASENDDVCYHPQYCVVPFSGPYIKLWTSIHSSGIRDGIIRCINAIRDFVYCHILRHSPHSQSVLQCISHCASLAGGRWCDLYRYSRPFFELNHIHHALSETSESLKFFHIRVQSVLDHSFCMRISGNPAATRMLVKRAVYSFFLWDLWFSEWACRLLQYCSDKCSRISQVSFLSVMGWVFFR